LIRKGKGLGRACDPKIEENEEGTPFWVIPGGCRRNNLSGYKAPGWRRSKGEKLKTERFE